MHIAPEGGFQDQGDTSGQDPDIIMVKFPLTRWLYMYEDGDGASSSMD